MNDILEVVKKPPGEKTVFEIHPTCYDCRHSDTLVREARGAR
jgi:hypothetical protein